jgi:superfamily II RNA helicase
MKLVDQLSVLSAPGPSGPGIDPDALYTQFLDWTQSRGLALYTAQDEAIMELATGANVILATPTGS